MPLTESQIAARTAVSTAVYQKDRLSARHIVRLRNQGIERIEISCVRHGLDYRDRDQRSELVAACRDEGVDVVSVHGPFTLPYKGTSPGEQQQVLDESLAALEFAHAFGAGYYVGHFGYAEQARSIISRLLDQTSDTGIVITTENQTGQPFQPYIECVRGLQDDRFGLTLDIGHARDAAGVNPFVQEGVSESWVAPLEGIVRNAHLHETFDLDKRADHRPPLHERGIIRWREILESLESIGYDAYYVFEDGRGEDPDGWVEHAATFARRYVERYGG